MPESVTSDVCKLLHDIIAPDLKSLAMRLEGIQRELELSRKSTEAQLEAFRVEQSAFRGELNAFRSDMNAFRLEVRAEFQSQLNLLQNEVLRETSPIRERLATLEAHEARS